MLLSGQKIEQMKVRTPAGIDFPAEIEQIEFGEGAVSCQVKKDGGDDPDVTTGLYIRASVSFWKDCAFSCEITGGEGIGIVTKPGLDQPVGNAAINRVPRQQITENIREVCELFGVIGRVSVLLSVPGGEEIAKKTFNERLGIVGGISIIGTSGIVEPMSEAALKDTIRVELRQRKASGCRAVAVSPGNYGIDFMKSQFDYDLDQSVKCSNFIGDMIDMVCELGFEGVLLTGHIGKLIKVSGGIMNTHSKEGDCRMELLCAAGITCGLSLSGAKKVLSAVTTEEAIVVLREEGILKPAMDVVMEKLLFHLNRRAGGKLRIECMVYANAHGLLGQSAGAYELLCRIKSSTGMSDYNKNR